MKCLEYIINDKINRTNIEEIDTNSLVLVMGEGDRNAAIGLVYEGLDKDRTGKYNRLKIRILTEFQGDDGNFYNTESYLDVSLNDIKLITPNDIHELSSIIWKYNLTVSDWFCKIIFSFAVHESMAKALSVDKTFLEYASDMIKESQQIFGNNSFKN